MTILFFFLVKSGCLFAQNLDEMTEQIQVTTVELTSFHLVHGADEASMCLPQPLIAIRQKSR
jgi:hypothetical protein